VLLAFGAGLVGFGLAPRFVEFTGLVLVAVNALGSCSSMP